MDKVVLVTGGSGAVGSAIVKLIEKHGNAPDLASKLRDFVKPLVDAVKSV